MKANSSKSSENSLFLGFTYSSSNEGNVASDRFSRSSKSSQKKKKTTSIARTILTAETSKTDLLSRSTSRLSGGENKRRSSFLVKSHPEPTCSRKAPGIHYQRNIDVTEVHLKLNVHAKTFNEDYFFCKQPPEKKPKTTRGTQTLYRESSAQTLPYLPEVKNDPKALKFIEVFKLPEILPGDGPPGLYEVEVLERARKRWAFAEALKENFKNGLIKARDQLNQLQHKKILESFAFEQWIEREEYIMECQMMRLEIVIRMFNQREQQMHENSKKAIELAYQKILEKRDAALKKNDIQYKRAMRRLESNKLKRPRDWRGYNKESLAQQLSDPQSLYYAPQTRFGVSPNQKHFDGDVRKVFDIETKDIEKMQIDGKNIECPFAKLNEWSKPKDVTKEIETNFLSDDNLQKLYETLKSLRLQFVKHKSQPKCLVKKIISEKTIELLDDSDEISQESDNISLLKTELRFEDLSGAEKLHKIRPVRNSSRKFVNFASQRKQEKLFMRILFLDRRREEIQDMVASYEGKTIGWILRFLGEEMSRLQELRKLHLLTILAQRERWRREAAEAGLRQKENEMREVFDEMFQTVDQLNSTACKDFFKEIIPPDTSAYADDLASNYVTKLAKQIDEDLNRWLKSFELIQNPTNYDQLRILLKDMVFPNIEKIMYRKEKTQVVHYIINDVLFPNVYKELETYDISFAISNDLVDRLIDNDLYFFSSECDSDCDCRTVCICPVEQREGKAILRKLVRYAVPGRRWKTSTERIAYENFIDILDNAFDHIGEGGESIDEIGCLPLLRKKSSLYDLTVPILKETERPSILVTERLSECVHEIDYQDTISLNKLRQFPSELDIHHPVRNILHSKLYSTPSLYLSETFSSSYKVHGRHKATSKEYIINILHEIINSIIMDCENPSILDWEEGEYEQYAETGSIELEHFEETLTEETETKESFEEMLRSDEISEDVKSYESSYEEISESELERMAEDKCKCREEILKEQYLSQQIAIGKVRIKRKIQDQDFDHIPEPNPFEYHSGDENAEQESDITIEYKSSEQDDTTDSNDKDSDSEHGKNIDYKSDDDELDSEYSEEQQMIDEAVAEDQHDKSEIVEGQATPETQTIAEEASKSDLADKENAEEQAPIDEQPAIEE